MSHFHRLFLSLPALLPIVFISGCYDPEDTLGSGGEAVEYEALDKLFSEEVFGGIDQAIDYGQPQGAIDYAKSPEFKKAVDEFEKSELPSEYEDRKADKDALVKAMRDLIAAAESGNTEAMEKAVADAKAANERLTGTGE